MTFGYYDTRLPYFDHPYNSTARNERAVELPVAFAWLDCQTGQGLEVGNVTSHYRPPTHRVVDLYEQAPGVDNVDLFDVTGPFDWVLSISTIEHVRWDVAETRDAVGAVAALTRLRSLMAPGGRMLVTVPFGHHPHLDAHLCAGRSGATRESTMVRDGDGWAQCEGAEWRPYGLSTIWAEAVWIGEWT